MSGPRPSRIERMITYLEEHRAEIEAIANGSVRFDFAGPDIKARVERTQRLGGGGVPIGGAPPLSA